MKIFAIIFLWATALINSTVAFENELFDDHDDHEVAVRGSHRELHLSSVNKAKIFTKYQSIFSTCCGADLSKCKCPVRTKNWFLGYPKNKWEDSCKKSIYTKASVGAYVKSNANLTTLVTLLESANLLSVLSPASNDGKNYTLFAPTNDAFAKITTTTATLTAAQIKQVLLYHVVSGTVTSTQLTNGNVTTLNDGQTIAVNITNGVTLNTNSKVTKANNLASNGVIHIIDNVLIPNL
jgi:uncharacterized surface protein with fasciclin (FAS1) repeats